MPINCSAECRVSPLHPEQYLAELKHHLLMYLCMAMLSRKDPTVNARVLATEPVHHNSTH
jgi:hypothetical protein